MLYEALTVILAVYVMMTPLFYYKAVKFGLRCAQKPEETGEEVFHLPKKAKKPKMTPEEDRMVQILSNIDRYDGTPTGQKEVKVKNGQ